MSFSNELAFGLDIGDASVKVLQLRGGTLSVPIGHAQRGGTLSVPFSHAERGGHAHAIKFAETSMPNGTVSGGEIKDVGGVTIAIKNALKNAHIGAQHVIASLPEAKTFLKLLHLPTHDIAPIAARVETELQKHIPYALEEIVWDFTIIHQTETTILVLAGAAPKILADSYTLAIRNAGLTAIELDLEPLAIARAVMKDGPRGGCALIADLGATKSTLILATGETVLHTADGKASGDTLTAAISEALKIDKGESIKKDQGITGGASEYQAIVQTYAKNLSDRIATIAGFPVSREFCPGVTEILLTGGGALLKGLPEYLTASLKIPARLGDPLINTAGRFKGAIPQEIAVRFSTAFGLAIAALRHGHI